MEFTIRDHESKQSHQAEEESHGTDANSDSLGDLSSDEIDFEAVEWQPQQPPSYLTNTTHANKFQPRLSNHKKILCFSLLRNQPCDYHDKCSYAHSLEDQTIEFDRKQIIGIILRSDDLSKLTDSTYKQLMILSYYCKKCKTNKCTGGFNCKHGTNCDDLKICKKDLLTGDCENENTKIIINQPVLKVMTKDGYDGCVNGHHLTTRGLKPYYKFTHEQENKSKDVWQSVRHVNPILNNTYGKNKGPGYMSDASMQSDETTDDEVNNWFKKSDSESTD